MLVLCFIIDICANKYLFQFVSDLSDDDKPPKKKTKKSESISRQEVYEYTTQPVNTSAIFLINKYVFV